jgi:hypothetical protein
MQTMQKNNKRKDRASEPVIKCLVEHINENIDAGSLFFNRRQRWKRKN